MTGRPIQNRTGMSVLWKTNQLSWLLWAANTTKPTTTTNRTSIAAPATNENAIIVSSMYHIFYLYNILGFPDLQDI